MNGDDPEDAVAIASSVKERSEVAGGVAASNGIQIAYETFGDVSGQPVLLLAGLGAPMIAWHPGFCAGLAGRGCYVIRFDNRDVGRSTHLTEGGTPDLMAGMMGNTSSAAYRLEDMADDAFGLLDALGLPSAHLAGVSMGAMIAQTMALRCSDRVRSLTSIMSTHDAMLSNPRPQAVAALMQPPPTSREEAVRRGAETARILASPKTEPDDSWYAEIAGAIWDDGADPVGVMRQNMAIYASGPRTEALRALQVPTLIIHGEDDPLVDVAAGRSTAELIPGAELLVLPAMGHELPRALWPEIIQAVMALVERTSDGCPVRAADQPKGRHPVVPRTNRSNQ